MFNLRLMPNDSAVTGAPAVLARPSPTALLAGVLMCYKWGQVFNLESCAKIVCIINLIPNKCLSAIHNILQTVTHAHE